MGKQSNLGVPGWLQHSNWSHFQCKVERQGIEMASHQAAILPCRFHKCPPHRSNPYRETQHRKEGEPLSKGWDHISVAVGQVGSGFGLLE